MIVKTRYFSEFDLDESEILKFPNGIFGFEDQDAFIVIRFGEDNDDSLFCLQSVTEEDLAFVLLNPFSVDPAYSPKPSEDDLKELKITDETPIAFFSIAVVKENFKDSTVNLRCPILVNYDTKTAKQIVLDDGVYSMRAPISTVKEEA